MDDLSGSGEDRPISGTSDWTEYQVVLPVAEGVWSVAYGLLLVGEGTAWIDDLHMETVSQ